MRNNMVRQAAFLYVISWVVKLVLIGAVVLFLLAGGIAYFIAKPVTPPSMDDAGWAIQTYSQDGMNIPSRIYFTNDIVYESGIAIMGNYWSFDGKKYRYVKDERELPPNTDIVRREQ